MKKQFLAILAIVAGLGLSAFTMPKAKPTAKGPSLYWYAVDKSTQSIPQGASHYDFAEDVTNPCETTTGEDDCVRGFTNNIDNALASAPEYGRGFAQKPDVRNSK